MPCDGNENKANGPMKEQLQAVLWQNNYAADLGRVAELHRGIGQERSARVLSSSVVWRASSRRLALVARKQRAGTDDAESLSGNIMLGCMAFAA
jgi:hypothetical protein